MRYRTVDRKGSHSCKFALTLSGKSYLRLQENVSTTYTFPYKRRYKIYNPPWGVQVGGDKGKDVYVWTIKSRREGVTEDKDKGSTGVRDKLGVFESTTV